MSGDRLNPRWRSERHPLARVVWFFNELSVRTPFSLGPFTVVPLATPDDQVKNAFKALAAAEGWTAVLSEFQLPHTNIVAIVYDDLDVQTAHQGLLRAGPLVGALAAAIGYRHKGRGRSLGAIVDLGPGRIFGTTDALRPVANTHQPAGDEAAELTAILKAFVDYPQGKVLADLFNEACRDPNPTAAIARLWAILEALADRFQGSAHQQVTAALRQLEIAVPEVDGILLTRRAYQIRNDFMHEGRVTHDADRLLAAVIDLVWFSLQKAGLHPVEPTRITT